MDADHAARVLAVAARLRAEAWRVRGEPERQRRGGDDLVAHEIGQRHFGGRDQIPASLVRCAALRRPEQILLEFRQLAGADQCVGIDQVRHIAFGVAVLARVRVEHQLRQRPVQARDRAAQRIEAGAGNSSPTCRSRGRRPPRRCRRDRAPQSRTSSALPQRRTSALSASERADRDARMRQVRHRQQPIARAAAARPRDCVRAKSTRRRCRRPRAVSADASSPLLLAMPISFETVLRLACSSWVRICICLRSASSSTNAAASS